MSKDTDVIIIGSGFAGSCAAWVLTNQGISTRIIERTERYPNAFRAEKIEPNQAENLRKFGMLDLRQPMAGPLGKTINYRNGKASEFDTVEQYGMNYTDTVNSFREALASRCETVVTRATAITNTDEIQTVHTDAGDFTSRLVIIASGGKDNLLKPLGIHRREHPSLTSLSFAFHMRSLSEGVFDFSGFNYFIDQPSDGVDYITIFKIGDNMRANLFTQWPIKSPLLREFKEDPVRYLDHYFPDLRSRIGAFEITTKVQSFPTTFYRLHGTSQAGVVVIGDDYQSVSPTTGTGLDKCTIDVDRLCNQHVPNWLQTEGMDASKIAQYYSDDIKRANDHNSLTKWISYRDKHRGIVGKQLSRVELHYNKLFDRW